MVDKIRPLKLESSASGGTENDFNPTEADPLEDHVSAKGMAFEGSDDYILAKTGRVVIPKIPDGSQKITYVSTNIDFIEFFQGATQTTPNRRAKVTIGYTGINPTSETWLIYDTDGTTILRTLTYTYTLTGSAISSMTEATT